MPVRPLACRRCRSLVGLLLAAAILADPPAVEGHGLKEFSQPAAASQQHFHKKRALVRSSASQARALHRHVAGGAESSLQAARSSEGRWEASVAAGQTPGANVVVQYKVLMPGDHEGVTAGGVQTALETEAVKHMQAAAGDAASNITAVTVREKPIFRDVNVVGNEAAAPKVDEDKLVSTSVAPTTVPGLTTAEAALLSTSKPPPGGAAYRSKEPSMVNITGQFRIRIEDAAAFLQSAHAATGMRIGLANTLGISGNDLKVEMIFQDMRKLGVKYTAVVREEACGGARGCRRDAILQNLKSDLFVQLNAALSSQGELQQVLEAAAEAPALELVRR
eukprot:TRINITY_DN66025_c0_g1_i1.p1 TRINITY_DN66025_c0_g1~~TRINITY_DN66025_c0_g1_i1.p1  ORF type:complete len:335 (-),score=81.17 TRINITY_DN66025_c0_g1_i1:11-1015(-)